MIIDRPDGSEGAAKVSNDARPCTTQSTSYLISVSLPPEADLPCRLWDTRGLNEAVGTNDGWLISKFRELVSQQASQLKRAIRDRTNKLAMPILVWCIDATKIEVQDHWNPFRKVYVEYCGKKAKPMVVITRGPSTATDWEMKCTEKIGLLELGVGVPFIMVRKNRGPSSQEYVEDSKALIDLISKLANR